MDDKDGLIMDLQAAEITARTGRIRGQHYRDLASKFGAPLYACIDATAPQKAALDRLSPDVLK